MGIFDGCLLACDVDGTLVENDYINPKNIEKIEYFMSQGGMFSIATGRSVTAIGLVLEKLKRISPSVVANGGMIYDYQNEKILHQDILPRECYNVVIDILNSGFDVGIEMHTGKRVFTLRRTNETDIHQKYEGIETTVISFEEASKYEWNKVIYTFSSDEQYDKLKQFVSKYNDKVNFVATCATLAGVTYNYLEQIPNGVSKATAINKLCDMFNIKKGCSYAIGDFYNDIEMLKNADICAVPNNAPEDIKTLADYIVVDCKEGAVADFIDYLIKIHK